jgi:16S rRNA (guanine966-N2)-methyltransferase
MIGEAAVVAAAADRFLADAARASRRFDLAFVDPPYGFEEWADLLRVVPADLVVVESGREIAPPEGWVALRAKRYGRTHVAILEPPPDQGE